MSSFWISWYHRPDMGAFELHSPWWVSGRRVTHEPLKDVLEEPTVVAAVQAVDEIAAKNIVRQSYDAPPADIEWRFCEPRPDDWTPFNDRFPKAAWMRWDAHTPRTP